MRQDVCKRGLREMRFTDLYGTAPRDAPGADDCIVVGEAGAEPGDPPMGQQSPVDDWGDLLQELLQTAHRLSK